MEPDFGQKNNEKKQMGLATFTCIFNRDLSKILLLKRNKEKLEKYGIAWGNIGGKVEVGELTKNAAVREIKEEIGVEVSPRDLYLIEIKEDIHSFKQFHAVFFIYATAIDESSNIIINNESESYCWFSLDNLPEGRSNEDVHSILLKFNEVLGS
jgi:8-oxo-dGTP pyrophosphatase MutT (NUDIX family)